jgi:hypothetical protein
MFSLKDPKLVLKTDDEFRNISVTGFDMVYDSIDE